MAGPQKSRLRRIVSALEQLRHAELAKQAKANAAKANALAAASALDAVNLNISSTWAHFPQNWLNFRSKLDQEVVESSKTADVAAHEAMRLEKTARRYVDLIDKISMERSKKLATEELLAFVVNKQIKQNKP